MVYVAIHPGGGAADEHVGWRPLARLLELEPDNAYQRGRQPVGARRRTSIGGARWPIRRHTPSLFTDTHTRRVTSRLRNTPSGRGRRHRPSEGIRRAGPPASGSQIFVCFTSTVPPLQDVPAHRST